MDDLSLINNTAGYRNPAAQSPLQGANVMQPAAVYSKIMLKTIELTEGDYVFDGLAQERTMPSNNGANEIVFKRMLSLAAHTQPLVEGIPPASDKGSMVAIKGSTRSYGRVMKFTDKVNWAVVDPLISEYTRQLALKIPETKDILAQEALLAEASVFYAQPKKVYSNAHDPDVLVVDTSKKAVSHICFLSPLCNPTLDEFRKIVLSEEAAKVRPHSGGNFLGLISSAVMFDLITDRRVKEYMRFAGNAQSYTGDVVVDLFSLQFKKAKTIKTDNTFIDADGLVKFIYHATGKGTAVVDTDIDADSEDGFNIVSTVEYASLVDASVVEVYNIETGEKDETCTTWAHAKLLAGIDVLNIHHSFVIGEEALFRIGVEGHTAPQFIKKELGSAGTEDPLNQRQSIGWKIDSLGYKVVNPDAVVDYMSIPSQYRINVNARPDLKNQFTDYFYGYTSADGRYVYPEQVIQTIVGGAVKYYIKGTTTEVTPIKMTKLVKPINGGVIGADGKKPVVIGSVPSAKFMLKSDKSIRFREDQVVKHTDGKYYIKGLAGTALAEVVSSYESSVVKADGTGVETRTLVNEDELINVTRDRRIDEGIEDGQGNIAHDGN